MMQKRNADALPVLVLGQPPRPARHGGASLFIAIIALVIMTIAGLALMRSVTTGNVIAGNMAFRASTVNATDLGVEAAAAYLNNTIRLAPDSNIPANCTVSASPNTLGDCRYSARMLAEDGGGLPLIDWEDANLQPSEISSNGNRIRYVVERLCNPDSAVAVALGSVPFNEPAKYLCAIRPEDDGNSKQANANLPQSVVEVMYRVTVRVVGPRNTVLTVQSILGR